VPTFLVTHKMPPELAARVRARVSGRRVAPWGAPTERWIARKARELAPRLRTLGRFVAVAALVAAVYTVGSRWRRERLHLASARATLLEEVRARGAELADDDRSVVDRADGWLMRLAGPYEGDFVDDAMRAPGAMQEVLGRPSMYVRGPVEAFASPASIASAAAASFKDPLVLCLVDPPSARSEKAMMHPIHATYDGGQAAEGAAPHVRLLGEAVAGLPYLLPSWTSHVEEAPSIAAIDDLRAEFRAAHTERALRALKATVLLWAFDEAGTHDGPTELDGERPHDIRLGLVDLAASKLLLRLRRHVDPAWISTPRRMEYAAGLDACALAYDVNAELRRR
jgi:hypothetical protein